MGVYQRFVGLETVCLILKAFVLLAGGFVFSFFLNADDFCKDLASDMSFF